MKKIVLPLFFLISVLMLGQTRTHNVQAKETIYGLSKRYKITQEALKKANPFLYKRQLQKGDVLTIPGNSDNAAAEVNTPQQIQRESTPKFKNYQDDEFYYRVIEPKENLYSLAKEYQTSQETIKSLNPFVAERGLQVGDVLRIPKEKVLTNQENPKGLHKVNPGETVYTIAKKNDLEPADVYAANRDLQKEGLKVEEYIKIPEKKRVTFENSRFKHKVQPKETIFSILRKYEITLTELLESNPALSNGLKSGMTLEIPTEKGANLADLNLEQMELKDYDASKDEQINVALILPFYLNQPNSYKGERQVAKEFYMGAQVALDELIKRGKKINVKIVDSENSNTTVDRFIKSNEIYKYDALIGPFFQDGLLHTAQTLEKLNIPIFSPVVNTDILEQFENIYLPTPRDQYSADIIAEEIAKRYQGEPIQLLTTSGEKNVAEYLKLKLIKVLKTNKVEVITNADYITLDKEMVSGKDENGNETKVEITKPAIAVLVSEDNVLGRSYIDNLLNQDLDKIKGYSVFFVPAIDVFDASNAATINKLKKINFVYTASRMINSFGQSEKEVLNAFDEKFCQLPTKYMAMGYDIMFDVVDRMNRNGFISDFDAKRVETRLSGKFSYEQSEKGKAKLNKAIRIIRLN
ncbi:membrane-bound lytic murein transglycosylase D [Candidatus Ornithobacterium hominis]|uniref:Membrane-bound lytic murein transglycosylase D n=1 Tax=Candidatus Ornithobacterium hominis TaxID=2497989 RepID=A0A383U228_9FLAO|nr:LysM peptidoglycan-binding domain-containing protein [Candidatus Ornithobacterium hominis]MCT7904942.1 LysM peptidoglycan-binding domain-containing protein [Candidatus Ornithobacterium hominis]SZD73449.1 membrane-bound lytic murein transglycosylase D [Candidatus Ornithobacterium hominis]